MLWKLLYRETLTASKTETYYYNILEIIKSSKTFKITLIYGLSANNNDNNRESITRSLPSNKKCHCHVLNNMQISKKIFNKMSFNF